MIEPYVYGMIETMVQNEADYLIEGVHFNPDFSNQLLREFPNDIRIVYLGYKDTSSNLKLIELNKYKNTLENVWYSSFSNDEGRDPPIPSKQILTKIIAAFSSFGVRSNVFIFNSPFQIHQTCNTLNLLCLNRCSGISSNFLQRLLSAVLFQACCDP